MTIKAKQMLVSSSKYSIKCPYTMTAEYITVHNTANSASGHNEVSYMMRNNNETSYHFAVDDKEVIQALPLNRNGWHAGDGSKGDGNRKSIGIEICYSKSGGEQYKNAEALAVKFIAQLLKERGWGIDKVKSHKHWTEIGVKKGYSSYVKNCPHRILDEGRWQQFLNEIQAELNRLNGTKSESKPTPKPSQPKTETKPSAPTNKKYTSIVDYLNDHKLDSSMANRKKLAEKYGIKGYSGTASQNILLLDKLQNGAKPSAPKVENKPVVKPKPQPKGDMKTTSIVTYLNSIRVNSSFANRKKLAKQYGVKGVYLGTAKQNLELLSKMREGGKASKPVSKPTPKPVSYKVGSKVKIKSSAKTYAGTNVSIPSQYKNKNLTIQQVKSDRVLIKELYSWVFKSDLQ